jgi:hypothetical protein
MASVRYGMRPVGEHTHTDKILRKEWSLKYSRYDYEFGGAATEAFHGFCTDWTKIETNEFLAS